jgi:DNA-binding transcriptional ArsR family regulator
VFARLARSVVSGCFRREQPRISHGTHSIAARRDGFVAAEASLHVAMHTVCMTTRYALADVAALVGEPTRAAILLALLDRPVLPAGVLALEAQLSASATSLHLGKLTAGGLLAVEQDGRRRNYRLASAEVAHALEALCVIATPPLHDAPLLPGRPALRAARTCYDHLAGEFSVALVDMLERSRLIRIAGNGSFEITSDGACWFARVLDIDVTSLARGRRRLALQCVDWTERRPHLAGALGATVLQRMLDWRWVARRSDSRALRITERGATELTKLGLAAPRIARDPRTR